MNLYFNHAFAKRPLPEVAAAMQPFLREEFENPLTESDGAERARAMLQRARSSVASLLGAKPSELYFVSSGTEANNWALKGAALANRKKNHIVLSAIEHFSVMQTAQFLQKQGMEVTFVPVSREGLVDPGDVREAIRPSTVLVSIQAASDEVGVIQDLSAISALRGRFDDVYFHTDAVQFLCYESLDLGLKPFDLVSLSSNALYGPAGIAALYIREGTRMVPLLHGGMQEEGMRPGLQSMALAAGFAAAAEANASHKPGWRQQLLSLQDRVFKHADELGLPVSGSRLCRLADNIHVVADVDGEALLTLLLEKGIRATSGSTCYQYAQKESHVLKALGFEPDSARGALLFTLGIDQTGTDIEFLGESLRLAIEHLRALKP